jgi:hypothetical protein
MAKETIFADGFNFKRSDKAPDFVVGSLGINLDDESTRDFIRAHKKNGWLNLNIKRGRSGNYYVELDTFEPTKKDGETTKTVAKAPVKEELPF